MVHEDVLNLMKTADDAEGRSALQEAIDFLADFLKDRAMSVKKIKTLSYQSGHSWITVTRAKEHLGSVHKKESFGSDWIWRLLTKENPPVQVGDQVAHTQKAQSTQRNHMGGVEQHALEKNAADVE